MRKAWMIFTVLTACCACLLPQAARAAVDAEAARAIAEEAYVFGYPLLTMNASKWVMTDAAGKDDKAPVNAFHHALAFPDASFTDVVSPNADTLYSQAWLDLSAGPAVLTVPAIDSDRYYVMQCLDGWTDVFTSVGTRTTGNGAGTYLLTGPGWNGVVPVGMVRLASPTNLVWILGRTETRGTDDYPAVHQIQKGYGLSMLDEGAVAPSPPPGTDTQTPPSRQMDELDDPDVFFERLCVLMGDNPPKSADLPLIERMALIGVKPGVIYDPAVLSDDVRAAVAAGFSVGRNRVVEKSGESLGERRGAWSFMPDNIGNFGTDYIFRAIIARIAIGANLPEEAVYPSTRTDISGSALNGANRYTIRFAEGQLPPVDAFWSITMYNEHQYFASNPIDRYAIGDRDELQTGEDGSVTIYVQHDSPGEGRESNWLPAPQGSFNMIMRLYLPDNSILDGSWPVPELTKAGEEQSSSSSGGCSTAGIPALLFLMAAASVALLGRAINRRCR